MSEEKNDAESLFLKKLQEEEDALLQIPPQEQKKGSSPFSQKKKKRKKQPPKKRKKIPGIALFGTAFLLFLVVISLLIFTMSVGGAGNPVLHFFGQNEDTVKDFLLRMVNGSFGFLSVFLLLVIALTLFFAFSRKKEEKQKRSIALAFTLVSLGLQFVTILAWLGMYSFVSALEVQTGEKDGSILLYLPDGTVLRNPISDEEIQTLVVPEDVRFSSAELEADAKRSGHTVRGVEWDFDDNGEFERFSKDSEIIRRIDRVGQWTIHARILLENDTFWESEISFFVPQGTFRATPETGPIPLTVLFDASEISDTRGAPVVTYEWDFDNDFVYEESTTNPTITRTFHKVGTYPVHLNVVKRDKTVQQYTKDITTLAALPSPIHGDIKTLPPLLSPSQKRTEVTKNDTILFQANDFFSTEGDINRYIWKFSDVSFADSGINVSHTFRKVGEVEVSLTVRDTEGNILEDRVVVVVREPAPKPKASFTISPSPEEGKTLNLPLPATVAFDASLSESHDEKEMASYEWDFEGDGIIDAEGKKVTFVYIEAGTFTPTLTVKNASQKTDVATGDIIIREPDLTAVIVANPENARVPCNVAFDGSLSSCSGCEILGYDWDFGDGKKTVLGEAHITHMYNKVGKFPVTLTVHTSNESASTTKNIFCRETPIRACFTSNKLVGDAPLRVVFDPECSTGTIVDWKWDFGDGSVSSNQIPTYIFRTPGTHTVTLTVTDNNGNIDSEEMNIVAQ